MPEALTPTPAVANIAQIPKEFSFADRVQQELADPNISGEAAGFVITGHFIGELVAHDGVEGSNGHRSPAEILGDIDRAGNSIRESAASDSPKSWADYQDYFSRTNGLREAVTALAGDERTSKFFGSMRGQLKETEDGIAFTGTAQMDAYLNALAVKQGGEAQPEWGKDIITVVSTYVGNSQDGRRSPFRDTAGGGKMGYENERQRKFDAAMRQAEAAGADRSMLERSTDIIANDFARRQAASRKAAQLALGR